MEKKEIHIATIFPDFFKSPLQYGNLKIAGDKDLVDINVYDLRNYSDDPHRSVDDKPFGGGPGMVMKPEPFFNFVRSILDEKSIEECKKAAEIILMTPRGKIFNQKMAKKLSRIKKPLIFLCGRYEGIDNRISKYLSHMDISIGDYVLSGGETACLAVLDSMVRIIPGVVGSRESLHLESFEKNLLDYPQYTRPREYLGYKVPKVLLSGNHRLIEQWRKRKSITETYLKRPDLINNADLNREEKLILDSLKKSKNIKEE